MHLLREYGIFCRFRRVSSLWCYYWYIWFAWRFIRRVGTAPVRAIITSARLFSASAPRYSADLSPAFHPGLSLLLAAASCPALHCCLYSTHFVPFLPCSLTFLPSFSACSYWQFSFCGIPMPRVQHSTFPCPRAVFFPVVYPCCFILPYATSSVHSLPCCSLADRCLMSDFLPYARTAKPVRGHLRLGSAISPACLPWFLFVVLIVYSAMD